MTWSICPERGSHLERLRDEGIAVRQADPSSKYIVANWVRRHFPESWAVGCEAGLTHHPVSCYIAVEKDRTFVPTSDPYHLPAEKIVGFACYDVASKGMFGPEGVQEEYQGRGIGTAL